MQRIRTGSGSDRIVEASDIRCRYHESRFCLKIAFMIQSLTLPVLTRWHSYDSPRRMI